MELQISPQAMTDAKASVITAGDNFGTAAKYPDATLTEAATAQSTLDDLGVSWGNRLERDDALVVAIGQAFVLVGEAFQAADSELKSYLDSIGYNVETK